MSGYATTPISGAYRPGVAIDDTDNAIAEALLAAMPGVTAAMQHGRPDRATLERARAAYIRAAKLPMSSAQKKQQAKAIAEAQRRLNEAPARDRELLEQLRVGLQMAASNVGMRVDGHAAHAFEVGVELMRVVLVILTQAFNQGAVPVDGSAQAA